MDGRLRRVVLGGYRDVSTTVMVSEDPSNIADVKDVVETLHPNNKDEIRSATAISKFEKLLLDKAISSCKEQGITYIALKPAQRLFITHFRCHSCKLVPLYYLDITHCKRVRCRRCGQQVSFKSNGKYGKIRKSIARLLAQEEAFDYRVP